MSTFTTSIVINAPSDEVWATLADIPSIHEWNPGVEASHGTSEETTGLGATRHCDLGGRNFLDEEVVKYETGRRLTMRIVDSNMPFRSADIHFRLEPEGNATTVSVSPDYRLKYGPVGAVMDRLMVRNMYEKGMNGLLRGLKEHVEARVAGVKD
ncbi:MAG: SRPBCC family protein [Acidimicrobiia bacterium]|nr:SRPBCC family protein [Acidimicrobiia bacterium]